MHQINTNNLHEFVIFEYVGNCNDRHSDSFHVENAGKQLKKS